MIVAQARCNKQGYALTSSKRDNLLGRLSILDGSVGQVKSMIRHVIGETLAHAMLRMREGFCRRQQHEIFARYVCIGEARFSELAEMQSNKAADVSCMSWTALYFI